MIATHDYGRSLGVSERVLLLRDGVVALDRKAREVETREIEALLEGRPPAGPVRRDS